ncbi:M20 family metallopeptidase [Homoserinibacter sp. GY 40078]|uniref:M20 metallopeptidase family protein n=1 Tax=Homoserinibacter sp. GY 40078 TaxID=2603275 RepID=UPI0011C8EAB2|nr:M20 family metallopeptidase [Homoserinibacter sp. GY 40078]TXK18878.1 amidohydrolase [Homoserinibacter sp. GY 40078]
MTSFTADAALAAELVELRRRLHGHPEVGLHLPRTQAALLEAIDGLGLEITTGRELTSITAVLRGGRPGPVVLLRSDMDGLPVTEATGLPFASVEGTMHACGHDLHMAGLVGAARMLAARRDELPGTVVFMFQPGEEGFAGARYMIDEGVLEAAGEAPVAAYAIHVDCVTPYGTAVTRPGPIMASASAMRVRVEGTGGHAAYPQNAIDPVPVAAEIVLAVQAFAARRIPAIDPAVISVTRLASDSAASNVLAASVELEANIRTLSPAALDLIRSELPRLVTAIGEAHGCTMTVEFIDSYPVTVNDPTETGRVFEVLDARYGDRAVRLPEPGMASEDFAYVLERVPGALVFLGVQADGATAPMHSPGAMFDDSLLGDHAALLAELAWTRLAESAAE